MEILDLQVKGQDDDFDQEDWNLIQFWIKLIYNGNGLLVFPCSTSWYNNKSKLLTFKSIVKHNFYFIKKKKKQGIPFQKKKKKLTIKIKLKRNKINSNNVLNIVKTHISIKISIAWKLKPTTTKQK